jgi:hypothetical protein
MPIRAGSPLLDKQIPDVDTAAIRAGVFHSFLGTPPLRQGRATQGNPNFEMIMEGWAPSSNGNPETVIRQAIQQGIPQGTLTIRITPSRFQPWDSNQATIRAKVTAPLATLISIIENTANPHHPLASLPVIRFTPEAGYQTVPGRPIARFPSDIRDTIAPHFQLPAVIAVKSNDCPGISTHRLTRILWIEATKQQAAAYAQAGASTSTTSHYTLMHMVNEFSNRND